jgi:hypothetical protein
MSFRVEFSHKNKILRVSFRDNIQDDDMRDYYKTLASAQSTVGPCSGICDFSSIDRLQVTSNMVKDLASRPPLVPAGYKHVIVAPQEHVYGLVRMYETLTGRHNTIIVRSLDEAYRALNLVEPEFGTLDLRRTS